MRKQIDFENGKILPIVLKSAIPMLVAQAINLLYNIVDRIYIGRIPEIGSTAIGAVGLCFPVIIMISAFANLFGSGGAPLFSIKCGAGDKKEARAIMNTSYFMLTVTAALLMFVCMLFASPMLRLFGASETTLKYSLPYMMIYLLGTFPSMVAVGMNPFINAQGFVANGMISVIIGALANILLDPLFIFGFGLGVKGAAIATVISQILSATYVLCFLYRKAEERLAFLSKDEIRASRGRMISIVSLGFCTFVMCITNSLVSIACNKVLVKTGGDIYITIMTIISSVRQMIEIPLLAIADGTSPIISYNYGARKPKRVFQAGVAMMVMGAVYALIAWIAIETIPDLLISIFSDDKTILAEAIPALKLYFKAFAFMIFQYTGQTTFKSLNKRGPAIFFSLLRKAIIVIPLTFLLPYAFGFGTDGVFMAEPVSNVIGGLACFITMLILVLPELKKMDVEKVEH